MSLRLEFDQPEGPPAGDEAAVRRCVDLMHDLRDGLSLIVDAAERSLGAPDGVIGWRDTAHRIERQARALAQVIDQNGHCSGSDPGQRAAAPAAARVRPSVFRAATGEPNRSLVLVVDDAQGICEVYADALGDRYDVALAGTCEDALRMALELEPALVLAEAVLPDGTGEDLVRALRRCRALDGVPVILVPANGSVQERTRLLTLGAEDVIAKPVGPAEVRERVDALLTPRWAPRRSVPQVDGDRVWSDRALRRDVDDRLLRAAGENATVGLVVARVGRLPHAAATAAGADAADDLLAELVGRMRTELGGQDLLARVEGRQLVAVLTRPSRTEALADAEAVAAAVREDLPAIEVGATIVRPASTTSRQALRRAGAALVASTRGGHRAGDRALRPALAAAARAAV